MPEDAEAIRAAVEQRFAQVARSPGLETKFPVGPASARVLGVRRPSVTAVAGRLHKAGLISYHRGRITVLNRKGLQAASCECYGVVKKEYDRLLG